MPLYEYRCGTCGHRFELIQKFSDPTPDACPACGAATVERLLSSPAIQFKGSGWYITDYARKDKSSGKSSSTKGEGGDQTKAQQGEGATKSETSSAGETATSSSPAAASSTGGDKKS